MPTVTNKWRILEAALPRIPKLIEGVDIVEGQESLQFRVRDEPIILHGKMISTLSPLFTRLLEGNYSLQDIIKYLGEDNREKIYYALWLLYENGLLEEEDVAARDKFSNEELEMFRDQLAFFGKFLNVTKSYDNKYELQQAIKDSNILLLGSGWIIGKVAELLDQIGVGHIILFSNDRDVTSLCKDLKSVKQSRVDISLFDIKSDYLEHIFDNQSIDFLGVVTPKPIPGLYNVVNSVCLEKRIQWTRMTMTGQQVLIGPTIVPFETACHSCFDNRFQANNPYFDEDRLYADYLNKMSRQNTSKFEYRLLSELAASIFIFEVIRILTFLSQPISYGALYSMDILTGQSRVSKVLKIPRCPSCSQINSMPRRRPAISSESTNEI
jgi:molybdopterin-synthase adenylyltransferase